jgi:maleate isomerase
MGLDSLGYRRLFGVLGPSTNTTVQPDYDDMRPPGVTNHYSRIFTPNAKAISNETFYAGTMKISEGVLDAVRSVMTCEPDYLVMGMSAITFYGGAKGAEKFTNMVEKEAGVKVSVGSTSCVEALKAYGGIKRIAFLSPYYPVANAEVRGYFKDMGFETVRDVPMQAPSWTGIAQITEAQCRTVLRQLEGPDVDRAGRHQPVDGAPRRRRRAVARQAGDRDQHRDLLARAARQRHPGQDPGLRAPARRVLKP